MLKTNSKIDKSVISGVREEHNHNQDKIISQQDYTFIDYVIAFCCCYYLL